MTLKNFFFEYLHGSAFAIAGKNEANIDPILNSFKIALTMAENKNKQ